MKNIYIILFVLLLIFILLFIKRKQLNQNFYKVEETYPFLNKIYKNVDIYKKEVNTLCNNKNWFDWVEKDLYKGNTPTSDWKILPFYGFGIWVKENCDLCPNLAKFIKSIPGLKVALLSKMGPDTVLTEHRGWGNHSNKVLRCHFGFNIPDNCFVSVGDYDNNNEIKREVKKYQQDKWLIFDDSKFHFTYNKSNQDRIVLIIDIERPYYVKQGTANVEDTKELKELIDSFRNKTLSKDI